MNELINNLSNIKIRCSNEEYQQLKILSSCLDSYINNEMVVPNDIQIIAIKRLEYYRNNINLDIIYPETYINYQVDILKTQIKGYDNHKSLAFINQIFKTLIKIVEF